MSRDVELTCLSQPPQGQLNVAPGVSVSRRRSGRVSLPVARGAAPSPASVSSGRSVFPCETSGSRAAPAKLGCLPWPEGLILSWWKLAPCHPANGPAAPSVAAARPRAAKPAAAEGQLELLPSLCLLLASSLLPFNSLPVCSSLSPSVHPSLVSSHPAFPL